MGPAVADVELVDELLAQAEPGQGEPVPVEELVVGVLVPVWAPDVAAVSEIELVQMRSVPAGEAVIDGVGQLPNVWLRAAATIRPGRGHRSCRAH